MKPYKEVVGVLKVCFGGGGGCEAEISLFEFLQSRKSGKIGG